VGSATVMSLAILLSLVGAGENTCISLFAPSRRKRAGMDVDRSIVMEKAREIDWIQMLLDFEEAQTGTKACRAVRRYNRTRTT
jgi:hypothetical protein